jgi:cytochrome b involved in lipid metabolism
MKLEEIAEHNQAGDLWLLINNKVYDVSKFDHPGKYLLVHKNLYRKNRNSGAKCRNGCNNLV